MSNKVLVINPYSAKGGAGEYQKSICRFLRAWRSEVVITQSAVSPSPDQKYTRLALYLTTLMNARRAAVLVRGSDLVLLQGHYNPASWVIARECIKRRKPYVLVPHGDFVPRISRFWLYRSALTKIVVWNVLGRRIVKHAAAVVVGSDIERALYQPWAQQAKNVWLIPNLIEDERSPVRSGCGSQLERYALWMGRISREKALDFLLLVWHACKARSCPGVLRLIGTAEDRRVEQSLRRSVIGLGLEKSVSFEPWAAGEEKDALLHGAHCLVLPSYYESFGRVVPEAMAAGTVPVVSDTTPWSCVKLAGGYWLPRDIAAWTQTLMSLMGQEIKPVLNGDASRQILERFSFRVLSQRWSDLLNSVALGANAAKAP